MSFLESLAESGWLPDVLLRWGMRRLLAQRLHDAHSTDPVRVREDISALVAELKQSPIAIETTAANEQHYEVPAKFFQQILGPRLKYSSCYYEHETTDLATAEESMLRLTCERAELSNGQRILELGCGWGSLTLWMAEQFKSARITAVSNSHSQREFIMQRAKERGLSNVEVVTCDMNHLEQPNGDYDRVISVEMFEHMRNYELLLQRISNWLKPTGKLFVHIFVHRHIAYKFQADGELDWMARNFFSGGIMPSEDLLLHFPRHLQIERRWAVNGTHYARTLEDWLRLLDARAPELWPLFPATKDDPLAGRALQRWRMFLMACAELFNYRGGTEWYVGHYLFRKASS
jgi:cyclopropane-fatty-acyl-phospholipid synthase